MFVCNAFELQMYVGANMSIAMSETSDAVEFSAKIKNIGLDWNLAESFVGQINVNVLDTLSPLLESSLESFINTVLSVETFTFSTTISSATFSDISFQFIYMDDIYLCLAGNISLQ